MSVILPAVPDTFYWTQESWGPALRCRPLEAVAPHVFTSRQLGLRGGADLGRWQVVAGALGVSDSNLIGLRQVHGRAVAVIGHGRPHPSDNAWPEGDAVVSDDERYGIVVQAADCVPLLLADQRTGAVAAAHAGWKGTAAAVACAAVDALEQNFGTRPADLVAAIGPSIGVCCYEVGSELVDAFAAAGHARHLIDRWFLAPRGRKLRLDLWAANRDQLMLAGMREEQVHICGLCTASNVELLYSYRAEGIGTGRLAAAIRSKHSGQNL